MKIFLAVILLLSGSFIAPDNITTRFKAPEGYHRVAVKPGSFAEYLRSLPLKQAGTPTKTYRGEVARTNLYTAAVVDISVGDQDLQQCADAVMRLRGEYLYQKKDYKSISFNFVSGFKCDYVHYAEGYRYRNNKWKLKAKKDYSYPAFMRYMELVFSYAGTISLEKETHAVTNAADLKAGDIFIHGGSPGHCFIVMDVVENDKHQKQPKALCLHKTYRCCNIILHGSVWIR
ncbi:DUF4846 domain-containing protein [Mucilaginibacter sp. L3T2-6]|uniref:DUF4846 domain-containing protein n=1 Tax=Mucilaginibacter sp. L3T2-6 TaxID=3062491 RepID=UPI00267605B7|nr:DUF4846 domain-containing protein [Mucilaginibacter sp. L3T2-6]MDO3645289.1 DUF4846 domain-containing protein [Mucilaginibacter sp. L3T2-6]MDV6217741.1 DUF4846 domain-containing protein [Mucilaginibacter sp. L3T2-6]